MDAQRGSAGAAHACLWQLSSRYAVAAMRPLRFLTADIGCATAHREPIDALSHPPFNPDALFRLFRDIEVPYPEVVPRAARPL